MVKWASVRNVHNVHEVHKMSMNIYEKGVIKSKEAKFTSGRVQSTNPMQARFSSTETPEYNIPFYLLHIDEKRLEELLGESESINIDKKYSSANEDILLKTLGVKIKGNYIIRGKDKEKINPTDKALIYFLYFKSTKNSDECFSLKDLSEAKEIRQTERYIKNRIADVNKSIRRIIAPNLRLKIGRFVKSERKRGYHLNPRILLIKPKK